MKTETQIIKEIERLKICKLQIPEQKLSKMLEEIMIDYYKGKIKALEWVLWGTKNE